LFEIDEKVETFPPIIGPIERVCAKISVALVNNNATNKVVFF
jgi:hypothetical protein